MSFNNYSDDSADFEESNRKGSASKSFTVSLISFLMIFILPFSLYFLPIAFIVIISSLFGVVLGHRTHNRLKKSQSSGRGLTIVGLVLGHVALVCSTLWSALWIASPFYGGIL